MNYAVIFAGGTGTRMNTKTRPKQFLKLHGKEIIIYTLEHFENHPDIDGISVVCIEGWIEYLKKLIKKYQLTKVKWVSPGGSTGQESIFKGLNAMRGEIDEESIVLIHDGVRPIIDEELITQNIETAKEKFTVGQRMVRLALIRKLQNGSGQYRWQEQGSRWQTDNVHIPSSVLGCQEPIWFTG